MANTIPLFEGLPPPPEPAPKAKRGSPRLHPLFPGATSSQRATAWRGLHPMGHPMPLEQRPEMTCGTCRWMRDYGAWKKCMNSYQTRGHATDTRCRWPGCTLWWPRREKPQGGARGPAAH